VEFWYTEDNEARFARQVVFLKESSVPKLTLSALGKLVRDRRGALRLRDAAKQIGISAATLMRIESGRVPDVETFGKVCRWLNIDPGDFLGFDATARANAGSSSSAEPPLRISAHLRAERLPLPETAAALARMLLFVAERAATGSQEDADF
jgi:DNA-binding Xre family transcriptional regulator